MKRKAPIWLKFFAVSVGTLFLTVTLITLVYMYQLVTKENNIIESNISNSIYYADLNVKNSLKRYSEQISNMTVAEQLYEANSNTARYRSIVNERLSNIYSESSEVLAVFYQDSSGICFSIGEIFLNIDNQIRMIHECMAKSEYTHSDGLWRYEKVGRGYDSIMLCKEIIYVDDYYNLHNLGTMLLYLDADKLNKELFEEQKGNGVVVLDAYGNIVLSADIELVGLNYSDVFKDDGGYILKDKNKYLSKKKEADTWKIISYIDMQMTSRNVYSTIVRMMGLILFGFVIVGTIAFFMSKRVGKPIEELLKFIKVNRYGEIVDFPEENESDIAQIKQIFESLSEDLKKNIESNYKMQLMLKDTKIKAYESQMNPHFLFNTLQMIQMLNVLGKKEDVSIATTCLGDLLRFNLDNRNEVTLKEEVENVVNYLRILELRFKGRFDYKIMIPDELMKCYTVKFMLQPIIENSVTHGFKYKKDMCELAIMGQEINGEMVIVIKDNGSGIDREQLYRLKAVLNGGASPSGIGLANVHERIRLIYGEKYGVDIFSDYQKNTQVVIHIPICGLPQNKEDNDVQISNN